MIRTVTPTPPTERPAVKQRDYLSYSAITTYQSCPLRFYFRYVAQLPERVVSSSLIVGSAIHRAVEHHFNELMAGNEPPSLEGLVGEFDAAVDECDPATIRYGKDECREDLRPVAERVLAAFQTNAVATPQGVILGVEEELRGPVVAGCPDLLGRIDLIVETGDAVVVTDLKTARTRWSREQVEESASQLLLYHELAKTLAPRKRVRLQFAVLTKAKQPAVDLHEVPVDVKQIDRTKRIVERVWKAIEAGHFFPAPSAVNCNGCPFRSPCKAW